MLEGMLKTGTKLVSEMGISYTVEKMIGSGGQGEVYVVESPNGKKALKWYYKMTSTPEQKNVIMNLVQEGAPSDGFLWPEDMIISSDGMFGYTMKLRPKEYHNIPDLLNRKIVASFESRLRVVFNVAKEYEALHRRGYSYKDISDKNLFFKPDTGEILICDNDNVSGSGMEDSGVYGTMDFMAPEIVRGEAMPSKDTDLHSLAVLIFEMLFISHPLNGRNEYNIHALDENARKALYGTHPIFIYDPSNPENRPVAGWHDNAIIYWDLYPKILKDKCIAAFTSGLNDPAKRVVEKEWKDVSVKLLDSIMICPSCGAEAFFDEEKEKNNVTHTCWNCNCSISAPPQIRIGKNRILLSVDSKIKAHHLKNNYDLDTIVASVSQNPNNPSQWGLKNETQETWTYIRPDGSQVMLPPGRNAALTSGAKINFGTIVGEI